MKKSSFTALVLGTIGGILFALGMCMVLVTEWNAFRPGVIMGLAGIIVLLILAAVWRKMEKKAPVSLSLKTIAAVLIGIAGTLLFGVGMCLSVVWSNMIVGVAAGMAGIAILLCLIPFTRGLK